MLDLATATQHREHRLEGGGDGVLGGFVRACSPPGFGKGSSLVATEQFRAGAIVTHADELGE